VRGAEAHDTGFADPYGYVRGLVTYPFGTLKRLFDAPAVVVGVS